MRKTSINQFKVILALAFFTVFTFFIAFPIVGLADADNIFVEDNAGILSNQDKSYIKNINEEEFINLPGKPQYAVVTLKNLDRYDSIEDYAEKKFQKLGIGDRDLDNGFLFVISVEDRKYRLETGYGVEDVITDGMKEDVVTNEATDLLQDEEYGAAVMLISKNVEKLVNEKYGDVEAAKEVIAAQKARDAKIMKMIVMIVFGVILFVLLLILLYLSGIAKIRKKISKNYLPKELTGYIYQNKSNQFTGTSKGIRKVNLSKYLAKTLYHLPGKQKVLSDDLGMKKWIGQYLLVDGVIQYWKQAKTSAPYDVSVYLESKYLDKLKADILSESEQFEYPVKTNPYISDEFVGEIGRYLGTTSSIHKENLRVSKENKEFIEKVSEQYLETIGVRLRKIDFELEVALMVYYFLQNQDLSDSKLLQKIDVNNQSLRSAYRFAEKRRKQISSDQKRKALNDLSDMTLGSYYMQAMIWSSYSSHSSGSSGGGGSSFGGGSSGGGGFSGGW